MAPAVLLILMLLIAGAFAATGAIYLMARGLVRPPRMTDGKALYVLNRLTPKDLDLKYENCSFHVRDERTGQSLRLAAWWIPAASASTATVLFVHGYADAKVGSIAWAPYWHELGFNILAIDLRAHGDSEGTYCSGGFHERHDIAAVIRDLVAQRPAETQRLVLFGASMGTAVAAGAAEMLTRTDAGNPPLVHGLVLDSPFVNFRVASAAHFRRLGLPGGRLASAAFRLAEWMTGASFTAIDMLQITPRIACPILVIVPEPDGYFPEEAIATLETTLASREEAVGRGQIVKFPEADHLMAASSDPERYLQVLRHFTESSLARRRMPGNGESTK